MVEAPSALGGRTASARASRWPVAVSLELRGDRGAAAQQEEEQGRQGSTLRDGQSQRSLCWKPLENIREAGGRVERAAAEQ